MSIPFELVETRARFDTFFEEERERLFKALYFVTGNREDAEELTQDAFLRLWERWDDIDRIDDLTGYLFRVALNGFRMRRRRAAVAIRKLVPVAETPTRSSRRRCGQTFVSSSSMSRRGSGLRSCSWTCSGTRPSRRHASCVSGRRRFGPWQLRADRP